MKPHLIVALVGAALSLAAQAEHRPEAPDTDTPETPATPGTPAPPAPPGSKPAAAPTNGAKPAATNGVAQPSSSGQPKDAARDALSRKEGDVDQATLLKETLTASDKQYSLIKRGAFQLTYDLNYTYVGQQRITADFSNGSLTLFNIANDSQHVLTNTLSLDYGLRNNLTANVTVPFVTKYAPDTSGLSNAPGDLSVGARWQPFNLSRDWPTLTVTGAGRLPTGRSPYKTIVGEGLSTGSGVFGATVGVNVSKIADPVALFGSINLSVSKPENHLNQVRSGRVLRSVAPGPSLSLGMGFAYAMSYNVSTTLSIQETLSNRSRLTFEDGSVFRTSLQTSGVMNFGLGWRLSPVTTLNINTGIGLTADSPNFSLSMSLPLHF
jgi:hypothetical protein